MIVSAAAASGAPSVEPLSARMTCGFSTVASASVLRKCSRLARRVGHRHHGSFELTRTTLARAPYRPHRRCASASARASRHGRSGVRPAASHARGTTRSRPVAVPDARSRHWCTAGPVRGPRPPRRTPRAPGRTTWRYRRWWRASSPRAATDTRQFEQARGQIHRVRRRTHLVATTETVSFSFSSRSIVATKSVPLPVYTHAVRTMCASGAPHGSPVRRPAWSARTRSGGRSDPGSYGAASAPARSPENT